ncbi:leucine-rich repeat domain-containing protein [Corallococcus sp. AB030]|uniref:leucine-rich repeat domain-containing protein n=1 Tax=Corallococcus sp. AB030 TaxID=2316716 RepID=UPI000ECB0DFB|nr:leucine-rich repeat domain-containing protein [Corallococcus sp. AB030]RKI19575.1 leucine-rich repeat domain-containing protein [Corallococcus sp. AB030]
MKKKASKSPARDLPFEIFTWSQVRDEVKAPGNREDDSDRVLVLTGNVVMPHDLGLDFHQGIFALDDEDEPPFTGLIVRGDLTVEGCVLNWENDFGPFLQVHGNLVAKRIAIGGARLHVSGDLTTEDLVAVYNHGSVSVGGKLKARTLASHYSFKVAGAVDAHRYLGQDSKVFAVAGGVEDVKDPYEGKGVFVPSVVRDGRVDLEKVRARLAAGKPVARDAFTSIREAFRQLVAKKLADPDKVKSLTLEDKALTSLPEELFLFRKLEKLNLRRNNLRVLPEELGQLTELRELDLHGNRLLELPESIGELKKLRSLDLSYNCLWRLPESLAGCVELRRVNLINNPHAYVRLAFGSWRKVQLMFDFPEVLTRLPKLEVLTFEGTPLRTLPTRRFDSTTLSKATVLWSLVTHMDPELHDQLQVDVERSREKAAAHIGYWFKPENVRLESFYDAKADRYDFAEVLALLALLLRINIPTAAPYDAALEKFRVQSQEIARHLDWDGDKPRHVHALFGALRDALGTLGEPYPGDALIAGLRDVFAARAG